MYLVANKLYQTSFDTSDSVDANNWHGGYSSYHNSEHEGFDFVYSNNAIYASGDGYITTSTSNYGTVILKLNNYYRSILYGHMSGRHPVSSTLITEGTGIGTMNHIGANGTYGSYGNHLHIEVVSNSTTGMNDSGNGEIDSSDPRTLLNYF